MSLEVFKSWFIKFISFFKISLINTEVFHETVREMKEKIEDFERSNTALQNILKDFELIVKERDFFRSYVGGLSSIYDCTIIAKNNDDIIVSVNKQARDRFTFFNDIEGGHTEDIIREYCNIYEDGKENNLLIKEILTESNAIKYKVSEIKSGFIFDTYGQFRIIKIPLITDQGNILGTMIIIEEITDKLVLIKDIYNITKSPGIKNNLKKLSHIIIPEFKI